MKTSLFITTILFSGFSLVACATTTQTTSGKSYLAKYQDVPVVSTSGGQDGRGGSIEDKIRQVAAVEPVLQFPARIGLAHIENGRLASISTEEGEAWAKLRDKLGSGFGEFVPVSALVANMVTQGLPQEECKRAYSACVEDIMNTIRLAAARQHLDAVLIYEAYNKTETTSNFLTMANVTIIGGYLLPSKSVDGEGFASAMLIDVMQGYPYGTVSAIAEKETALATSWGSDERKEEFAKKMKTKAVTKLTEELEEMFKRLRLELAEKRAKER
jgi:hypothetical protein